MLEKLRQDLFGKREEAAKVEAQIKALEAQIKALENKDSIFDTMFNEIESYQVVTIQPPKNRPSPRRTYNSTEKWLYDGKSVNYEKLREFCLRHGGRDTAINFAIGDLEDYFQDFIVFICDKNNLSAMVDNGKEPTQNSIFYHFKQFVWRASMVEGQDALQRQRGRKTQQECKRGSRYHYQSEDSAKVVTKVDEDNPENTEVDYFYDYTSEAEKLAEADSISNHVKHLLTSKFGQETGLIRYGIYRDKVEGTYQTHQEWAEAKGITTIHLKKHIEVIEKVIAQNPTDFGY